MKCPLGSACPQVEAKTVKPRSVEQIRRYFAIIRIAFHNWPEAHPRQFSSSEELRAWLQVRAGARDVAAQVPIIGMRKEAALMLAEATIKAVGVGAIPEIRGDTLVVYKPRSVAFARMGPAEFGKLSDAVSDVIRQETGIDVETGEIVL